MRRSASGWRGLRHFAAVMTTAAALGGCAYNDVAEVLPLLERETTDKTEGRAPFDEVAPATDRMEEGDFKAPDAVSFRGKLQLSFADQDNSDLAAEMTRAGLALVDTRCRERLAAISKALAQREFADNQLSLVEAITLPLLATAEASAGVVAGVGAGFRFISGTGDNLARLTLLTPDFSALKDLALERMRQSRALIEADLPRTYWEAYNRLDQHDRYCMTEGLRGLVNEAVQSGDIVARFDSSVGQALLDASDRDKLFEISSDLEVASGLTGQQAALLHAYYFLADDQAQKEALKTALTLPKPQLLIDQRGPVTAKLLEFSPAGRAALEQRGRDLLADLARQKDAHDRLVAELELKARREALASQIAGLSEEIEAKKKEFPVDQDALEALEGTLADLTALQDRTAGADNPTEPLSLLQSARIGPALTRPPAFRFEPTPSLVGRGAAVLTVQ